MNAYFDPAGGWLDSAFSGGKEACVGVAAKDCVEAAICNPI